MHIRPYQPHDSLALASIKAHCDLSDPLALFCRRQPPSGSQTACDKQWREHIKSLRRSLELELLLSGTVCWVVVLDDDDDDDDNENDHNRNQSDKDYADTENQSIVGFALWNRYGFSSEAREWKAEGCRLSRRMYAYMQQSFFKDANQEEMANRNESLALLHAHDNHIPLRHQHRSYTHGQISPADSIKRPTTQ